MSIIEKALSKLGVAEVDEDAIAKRVAEAEAAARLPLATLERVQYAAIPEVATAATAEAPTPSPSVVVPDVSPLVQPPLAAVCRADDAKLPGLDVPFAANAGKERREEAMVGANKVTALSSVDAPSNDAAVEELDGVDRRADAGSGSRRQVTSRRQLKLNMERLRQAGVLTPDSVRNQMAEEYRIIKRPILNNAFGPVAHRPAHANLVMVASSVPGEGKTFTAINLAMSVAMELDRTVLLIDADVLKPQVTRLMGIQAEVGLTDVLLDRSITLSDVLIRTDIPRLSVLPAGRPHANSNELLASQAMTDLAEELSQRYPDRLVIFDSPPLLVTTEARIVAGLMGQIVLVVEAEKTLRPMVRETLSLFGDDKVVGLVLNKSRQTLRNDFYGYGQYGQYGQQEQS